MMSGEVQPLSLAELSRMQEADRARYKSASEEEKQQITIEFRSKQQAADNKGTVVEKMSDEVQPTEEQREAKQAAQARANEEIRARKEASRNLLAEAQVSDANKPAENAAAAEVAPETVTPQPSEAELQAAINQELEAAQQNQRIQQLEAENAELKRQVAEKQTPPAEEAADEVEAPVAEKTAEEETAPKRKIETAYAPKVLNDFEREHMEKALQEAGTDKPLYKSAKARRKLRKDIKEEMYNRIAEGFESGSEEKDAKTIRHERRLARSLARKGSKAIAKDIAIGDKIEHTRVVDSAKEKRELKDDMTRKELRETRVRRHVGRYISDENVRLHADMEANEISSHEAAIKQVDDNSGDRTFEPNEVKRTASESSNVRSRDKVAKRELKRLGYNVKDDSWKNILAGIGAGALTAAGTAALPIVVKAAAETLITLDDVVIGSQTLSLDAHIHPYKNAAIAGGTAAILSGALFGGTEDEDVLHGTGIDAIFRDDTNGKRAYENMSFGSKKDTEKVKLIMRAIDELDLTDAEKTGFLAAAAGEDSQKILSKKELVLAYVNAALNHDPEIAKSLDEVVKEKCPCEEEEPETPVVPAEEEPVAPVEEAPTEEEPTAPVDEGPKGPTEETPEDDGAKQPVDNKPKTVNGGEVTVMNGESFNKIAKKYGVDVNQLKELNKSKIHKYTDCNGKTHYFFRVGEKITLPDGANADAVKENQDNVKVDVEKTKYRKAVTKESNIEKLADENCPPKTKAQGDEVDKLVQDLLGKRISELTKADIKNIENVLRSSVIRDEARTELEAKYKELTGKDFVYPPKAEEKPPIDTKNPWNVKPEPKYPFQS